MEIFDMSPKSRFVPTTTAVKLEILTEPYLVVTRMGYAPMVTVRALGSPLEQSLFISSKSITEGLEKLRVKNSGQLSGLKLTIQKESEDQMSRYIVTPVSDK